MDSSRDQKITALYAREADHLHATVTSRIYGVDRALIEDACAFAWAALVSHPDVDPDSPTAFAWLATVAIREAWRLAKNETANLDETPIEIPVESNVADVAIARDQLALLDQLKDAERIALTLFSLGLSYDEIAAAMGWTYTKVNRSVTEGRRAIRKLADGE